jgi:phage tail sheath protein FI
MPEFLFPGVYLEEIPTNFKPIEGVDTSTTAMVGVTERGPLRPELVKSFAEFTHEFGARVSPSPETCDKWTRDPNGGQWWHFPLAVKGFFENGGQRLYINRISRENLDDLSSNDFVTAIESLDEVDDVRLRLAPGLWSSAVHGALIKRGETRGDCFAILDPPNGLDPYAILKFRERLNTPFAALYYPWIEVAEIGGRNVQIGPSAHVAGVYARIDQERGVHKAPANAVILGINKLAADVTTADQKMLNPEGINALRSFPGRGNLIRGARTLSQDPEWRDVPVRRLLSFLEQSIVTGTQWIVFEPNDELLWTKVRVAITSFLTRVWRNGALQGRKPDEAFFVKCDRCTMTQDDLDQGRLVCLIGVAPLKPAEFVLFRIGQWTADRKS